MQSFLILAFSIIVSFQAFSQELETRLDALKTEKTQLEIAITNTEREVATLKALRRRLGRSFTSIFANLAYVTLRETCDLTNLLCDLNIQSEAQLNNILIVKYTELHQMITRLILVSDQITLIRRQILARDVQHEADRIENLARDITDIEISQLENQRRLNEIDRSLTRTERNARRVLREARESLE